MADFTFDPRVPSADTLTFRRSFVSFETTLADAERMLARGNLRLMPRLLASASRSTRAIALYRYAFGYPLPYVALYFCRSALYKLRELAMRPQEITADSKAELLSQHEPYSGAAWPTLQALHAALVCGDIDLAVALADTIGHALDMEYHPPVSAYTAYAVRDILQKNDAGARANIAAARSHDPEHDSLPYMQTLEGILDGKRSAINSGLNRLIKAHLAEYGKKEERFSPERFLSIAGLALVRLAQLRGLKPLTRHPLIPYDLLGAELPDTLPYIDMRQGYRFEYPALWALRQPDKQSIVLGNLFVNGGEITLELQAEEPEIFAEFVKQTLARVAPEAEVPEVQAGSSALDIETTNRQMLPVHLHMAVLEQAGCRFGVLAESLAPAWDDFRLQFDAIVASIQGVTPRKGEEAPEDAAD